MECSAGEESGDCPDSIKNGRAARTDTEGHSDIIASLVK